MTVPMAEIWPICTATRRTVPGWVGRIAAPLL